MRAWLATLCVALSLVFAGASAASVVDQAQHAVASPHDHAAQFSLTLADHDHHADVQDDSDRSDAPDSPQTGPGHHHADAPVGAPGLMADAVVVTSIGQASLASLCAAGANGIRPGGLERPPKPVATRV